MKLLVINNLLSGYRDGAIYDFVRSFLEPSDEICIRCIDGSERIERLLDDAALFDAVVASGGDGTVAAVAYALRGTGIRMLPFPAGTANLMAMNLHSPNEPHALAQLARNGKSLDFDIGEIEIDGMRHGFTMMSGCGYDAKIMHDAEPNKLLWGPMAYFTAAFANPNPTKSKFTISLDGQVIEREGVGVVLANFSRIQFDITLADGNKPRDGLLDVLILKVESALNLLPSFIGATLSHGANLNNTDMIEMHHAREVEVRADPALEVQYDGEIGGSTEVFKARILRHAMRLIVSDAAFEEYAD